MKVERGNPGRGRPGDSGASSSPGTLPDSQTVLRLLADNLPVLISYVDTGLCFRFVNRTYELWYGRPREQFLGRRVEEVVPAESYPIVAGHLARALAGRTTNFESSTSFPDGRRRHLRSTLVPHTDDSGRVAGLFVLVADVTERRRAEDALRASEARYRDMFDAVPFALIVFDHGYHVLEWSRSAERIFGWRREEAVGRYTMDFLVPEETGEEVSRRLRAVRNAASAPFHVNRNLRKDGSQITCRWQDVVFRDSQGRPNYILATAEDITHQVETEEQLRQALKMEAVGRLAGGIAHDFNNLLTAILGYAEMIRMEPAVEAAWESAAEIQGAARRAASLTRQLLAFSRKQAIRPATVDVNVQLHSLGDMLRRLIGENIELVESLQADPALVRLDPGQFEQMVLNLAVNARDAMPRDGTLVIGSANREVDEGFASSHPPLQPGPHVELSVRDSGEGMDGQTLSRVFEPFFTTKEAGKGTGLGLSTVHGIVKGSLGTITVSSRPRVGTTFRILLPCTAEGPEVEGPAGAGAARPGGGETVLLVEDEQALREMARKILERKGYRVTAAVSGREALALAGRDGSGGPELLLTDVIMPEMNGRELAKQLLDRFPDLRVLYISGYPGEALGRHGVPAAGLELLAKPFAPEELARRVREVLDR